MADKSFIEKKGDEDEARDVGISYKIRRIGFPVAVVLCLLLLVVCIVLAVLYSKEVTKTSITPTEQKYETCDEERCFRIGMGKVMITIYKLKLSFSQSRCDTKLTRVEKSVLGVINND